MPLSPELREILTNEAISIRKKWEALRGESADPVAIANLEIRYNEIRELLRSDKQPMKIESSPPTPMLLKGTEEAKRYGFVSEFKVQSRSVCPRCSTVLESSTSSCANCQPSFPVGKSEVAAVAPVALNGAQLSCIGCVTIPILIFLFGLITSPNHNNGGSGSGVEIGRTYTLHDNCFGSIDNDDLGRAVDMLRQKDSEAFASMVLSGRIVELSAGTTVTVEEVSLLGRAKVRVTGEVESVWVSTSWL